MVGHFSTQSELGVPRNLKITNLSEKDIQNLKQIKIIELEEMELQDLKILKVKIEAAIDSKEKE
ncbi:MAG: hypothetical protein ACFNPV_09985 [Corynebacterium matruchotii]